MINMGSSIKQALLDEIETYGLFVSILMILSIIFLILSFTLLVFLPSYYADNCELKLAFASVGTFLVSTGLFQRARNASNKAGKKK